MEKIMKERNTTNAHCIFMEGSVNQNDWDEKEEIVKINNGGILPIDWDTEIYKKGVYTYTKARWEMATNR